MERVKGFLRKIFVDRCNKPAKSVNYDHVVTIEEVDGSTQITKEASPRVENGKRRYRMSIFMDILICCVTCMLWTSLFSLYMHLVTTPPSIKTVANEYLFLIGSIVVVMVITVSSSHFESIILKGFERMAPKVTVVVKKGQTKKSYILRIRQAGTKEFTETEIEETKLTYDDVLEVCCKEINIEKEKVQRLWKVPETRIRNDDDVKRFKRVEYIEVHV